MKQLIFLLCLCVAITTVVESQLDHIATKIHGHYFLPQNETMKCFHETNITVEDLEVVIKLVEGEDITDKKDSALRIGCLFACVFKKMEWLDGTRIRNVQQLKTELRPQNLHPGKHSEILDTCNNRIKNLNNECKVMLNFIQCIESEKIAILLPWLDSASERVASKFSLLKTDAKNCFIETKINLNDLVSIRQLLLGENLGIENSAYKIGCLYACVFQKKGWRDDTSLKTEALKEELSPKHSKPKKHNEILDICTNLVKNSTDKCEMMINFIRCMISEQKRNPS